jgi:hypothetical protein
MKHVDAEVAPADAAEDALFGVDGRGDERPGVSLGCPR